MKIDFLKYKAALDEINPIPSVGRVTRAVGSVIEGVGPAISVGDVCQIFSHDKQRSIGAEVVGFRDGKIILMPLGELRGIGPGSELRTRSVHARTPVGDALLGRVIDGFGRPIDKKGPIASNEWRPLHLLPLDPLNRPQIKEPLATGVRAIDGLITCGKGQRVGLFAGSGVGKSVLMGMVARNTSADVNVIALIGERGREIREFIEKNLGEEGLRRSVVVAVPSEKTPMLRVYGALAATSIAEYFCEQGKNVFLMIDSATRVAMALREIGLASGEPPATKGYTPSVYSFLPKLLERAGCWARGSITGFYTVLVEGDDMDDPVADIMRSILDGHVVLTRKLASRNHYPAIDVLESVSRLMVDVSSADHQKAAARVREVMSIYRDSEDLISVGAYVKGSQPKIDDAITRMDGINRYLRQGINEKCDLTESVRQLGSLCPA